jgi:hypothetical protein
MIKETEGHLAKPIASQMWSDLLNLCGQVYRAVFFTCAGIALLYFSWEWIQQFDILTHTKFADLTLASLGGIVATLWILLSAWWLFYKWAFAEGEKNYKAWAKVVPVAMFIAFCAWSISRQG